MPITLAKIVFVDFGSAFNTILPHILAQKRTELRATPITFCRLSFKGNRAGLGQLKHNLYTVYRYRGTRAALCYTPILYTLCANDCRADDSAHRFITMKLQMKLQLLGFLTIPRGHFGLLKGTNWIVLTPTCQKTKDCYKRSTAWEWLRGQLSTSILCWRWMTNWSSPNVLRENTANVNSDCIFKDTILMLIKQQWNYSINQFSKAF